MCLVEGHRGDDQKLACVDSLLISPVSLTRLSEFFFPQTHLSPHRPNVLHRRIALLYWGKMRFGPDLGASPPETAPGVPKR